MRNIFILILSGLLFVSFSNEAFPQKEQNDNNEAQVYTRRPNVQVRFLGCAFGDKPVQVRNAVGKTGYYKNGDGYKYRNKNFGGVRWHSVDFGFDFTSELYYVTFTQVIDEAMAGDAVSTLAAGYAFFNVMLDSLKERYGNVFIDVSTDSRKEYEYRGPNNVEVTLSCFPGKSKYNKKAMIVELEYVDLTRDDAEYKIGVDEL